MDSVEQAVADSSASLAEFTAERFRGACDRAEAAEAKVAAVEALADSWSEGVRIDLARGATKAEVEPVERLIGHIRGTLAASVGRTE